jgi:hypothetical protein
MDDGALTPVDMDLVTAVTSVGRSPVEDPHPPIATTARELRQ